MTSDGPAGPPVTLAGLLWDLGDAYVVSHQENQWVAARRDAGEPARRPGYGHPRTPAAGGRDLAAN